MTIKWDKWLFLAGGLLAGILIGRAWSSLDRDEIAQQPGPQNTVVEAAPVQEVSAPIAEESEAEKPVIVAPPTKPKKEVPVREVVAKEPVEVPKTDTVPISPPDSALAVQTPDSLPNDSLPLASSIEDAIDTVSSKPGERIIVRKERMEQSVGVVLVRLDSLPPKAAPTRTDSLLEELTDVREPEEDNNYVVEFWSSPINYQGYKMANNKLILFGLETDRDLRLLQLNQEFYLQHLNEFYRIGPTFAFKAFDRIEDEGMLKKLASD